MNLQYAISFGAKILKKNNISLPSLDSEILISKAINKKREYVLINLEQEIGKKEFNLFNKLILSRSRGKPIAYIVKKKSFWKNDFYISSDVLIPRPETEIIVDQTLKLTKYKSSLNILDVGVGSGCILLSILNERKDFYGTGIDINAKSLLVSKINAKKFGLRNKVKFFKSDIDNFNYGKYDLIISNPPYIKKLDLKCLEKDVIGYEPRMALDGGIEGLSEIRKVINKSSELIRRNGKLILEIAFDQKKEVKKILSNKGFYINKVIKDLANKDRCIISTKI